MSEQRDEEQSAQQRERNDFYLGRSRRAKGGLGEKAVVEEISSLRGGVRERADARRSREPQRGALGLYDVVGSQDQDVMLWCMLLFWGKSRS